MEPDTEFIKDVECDMTLYALSLVKTSIYLWEQPDIQDKIQDFFSSTLPNERSWSYYLDNWHEITQEVLNIADRLIPIPPTVLNHVKDAIINTGYKIYEWISHAFSKVDSNTFRVPKIIWTPSGLIDLKKNFKTLWVEKYKKELIEAQKKLQLQSDLNNIDLELIKNDAIALVKIASLIKSASTNNCKISIRRKMEKATGDFSGDFLPYGLRLHYYDSESEQLFNLLYYFPLEVVIRQKFNTLLHGKDQKIYNLNSFLEVIGSFIKFDHRSGLPVKRNVFQKLLIEVVIEASHRKLLTYVKETEIFDNLIQLCDLLHDFTILKAFLSKWEYLSQDYKTYLRLTLSNLRKRTIELDKIFLNQLLDSHDDRRAFLIQDCYESNKLKNGRFDEWKNYYSALFDYLNMPFGNSIDPIECLLGITVRPFDFSTDGDVNCVFFDFIKWWHKSEKDQKILEDRFKKSPEFSKCIYNIWQYVGDPYHSKHLVLLFLKRFFDDSGAAMFKKERLSLFGLFHHFLDVNHRIEIDEGEDVSTKVQYFIEACEITPECLIEVKAEIRDKIEDLFLSYATVDNIITLNFLLDWLSISNEIKKNIFQKLIDSSQMLHLCVNLTQLDNDYDDEKIIVYNKWLRHSGDISGLKCSVISVLKSEKGERFASVLSLVFEKIERGEILTSKDFK